MSYILSWLEKQKTEDDWREKSMPISVAEGEKLLANGLSKEVVLTEILARAASEFPVYVSRLSLLNCYSAPGAAAAYNPVVFFYDFFINPSNKM